MKKYRWLVMFTALILVLSACGTGASEQEQVDNEAIGETTEKQGSFHIGVIPEVTGAEFELAVQKLGEALEEVLPYEVEINIYPDYNGVLEALNFGHIQMAWLGPSTYVKANHESGALAISTRVVNGTPYYHSYIITHVDSPWDTLEELVEDVANVTFAFGDISSTSGSIIPSREFKQLGIFVDENNHQFKNILYTGSHDATGIAVQNKHVDAGAIDSAHYYELIKKGLLDEQQFKVLWKSEELYQYPWVVSASIEPTVVSTIQETLASVQDPVILEGFNAEAFINASDENYEFIRQIMIETGKLK